MGRVSHNAALFFEALWNRYASHSAFLLLLCRILGRGAPNEV